mgnify:CR=1 FL=1
MYSAKVMDHFEHPRNVGEIENASGVGTVGNAKCGDIMRIFLDIDDDEGLAPAIAAPLYKQTEKASWKNFSTMSGSTSCFRLPH